MSGAASILVLDGATGTELDRAGVDVSLPLWSARAIAEAPEVLRSIHEAYLEAGAGAITTCTFRTHERSLARGGWGGRGAELTARAVEIAREARDRLRPQALVLGSVAPLEECYAPRLAPEAPIAETEHAQLVGRLLEAGVDMLLIETMGTIRETVAAMRAAERQAPGRWMVSVITAPGGPPGKLLSGEPVEDLFGPFEAARAVGVNCVAAPRVLDEIRFLAERLDATQRIAAYANVGHADAAGNWISTDAVEPDRYAACAAAWVDAGASLVGGCCGTTPATIRAVAERILAPSP